MENPVLIFGAKGLGPVAQDIFEGNGVTVYGYLDDDQSLHGEEVQLLPVYAATDDDTYINMVGKKCEAFIAIDEVSVRRNLVEMLQEQRQVMPTNAIHNQAVISKYAKIGHGNLIAAGVTVAAQADIADHTIIHPGAHIEQNAKVGDFAQIGAGSLIGAGATISDNAFLGTGVVVVPGISIGKSARIGAGSVVVEDVPARTTVFGNPAKKI